MKKLNRPKAIALCVLTGVLGSILVAFQNFTPKTSEIPSDVSDLYMNSALSTALKTKASKGSDSEDRQFALRRDTASEEQAPKVNDPESSDYDPALDDSQIPDQEL